jgi:hypothetical protein
MVFLVFSLSFFTGISPNFQNSYITIKLDVDKREAFVQKTGKAALRRGFNRD